MAKALGAEWKAMSAEAKAPYEERARADKERYAAEVAQYKAGGGGGSQVRGCLGVGTGRRRSRGIAGRADVGRDASRTRGVVGCLLRWLPVLVAGQRADVRPPAMPLSCRPLQEAAAAEDEAAEDEAAAEGDDE